MGGETHAVQTATRVTNEYNQLVREGVELEHELESYYLRQEAFIRKRVTLLDEIQANIADERRCLEAQHQECRAQISGARRHNLLLQSEQSRTEQIWRRVHSTLDREEQTLDLKLQEAARQLEEEDQKLHDTLEKKLRLEEEEKLVEAREEHHFHLEQELERALRELSKLSVEVEQRKRSLQQKNDTILEWNRTLEARERELVRCQDQLCEDLRQLQVDETRLGVNQGMSAIAPVISQREVMDDHDMSIQHEDECEEIDHEEEDELS